MHSCMDWSTTDFHWGRARVFLATAEEGSFSAAARALGSTQPTVGRQVAALEEELSVVLFERIGARLELTPAGLELADHVRAMAEAAARVSMAAAGRSQAVEGVVRITASDLFTAHLLPPALARLRAHHPGILVELVASNTVEDLQRRQADIAVRHFPATEPELVLRKLGERRAWFYAAPAYLERAGLAGPVSRRDLARADFIGFDPVEPFLGWLRSKDVPVERSNLPITCPLSLVQWELCRAGLGLAAVMEDVAERDSAIVRLDSDLPPFPVPVYLTAHRALRTSRRLRVVWDVLVETLSGRDG